MLHVPLIIGMVGALLILDDIDDRTVLILRVSPITVPRYLAYRATTVAAAALLMLSVRSPSPALRQPAERIARTGAGRPRKHR